MFPCLSRRKAHLEVVQVPCQGLQVRREGRRAVVIDVAARRGLQMHKLSTNPGSQTQTCTLPALSPAVGCGVLGTRRSPACTRSR